MTWSSSDAAVATVAAGSGLAHSLAPGPVTITATDTASGLSGTGALTVTTAALQFITVSPPTASAPVGLDRQFVAVGHYSDATTATLPGVTWLASDTTKATVDSIVGLAHGVAPGSATITATDAGSGFSGTATLTVTAAVLQSVTLAPPTSSIPVGVVRQFTATGHFDNGTHPALTSGVTRSSSNDTIATVDGNGIAHGVATGGPVTITAKDTLSGQFATASLTVTAAAAVTEVLASQLPFAGAVNPGTTSHFRVSGLQPGVDYLASLAAPPDRNVLLDVYADLAFTTPLCSSWAGGAPCPVAASPSGDVFVIVSGTTSASAGAAFNLDVSLRPVLDAQVAFPLQGFVETQAFYKVVGLAPGALFEAKLEALSDDADIFVTDGAGPAALVLCSGNAFSSSAHSERCLGIVPVDGAVFVRVDGTLAFAGANFTMTVAAPPVVPLDGTVALGASLPGTVDNGVRHYVVTGLTPGTPYTVTLAGLTGDVDLAVYADSNFGTQLCSSGIFGLGDESCLATAAGTELFVLVDGFFGLGPPETNGFTLTVTP